MFTGPSKARNWKCPSKLLTSPSFPASSLCASRQASLMECSCLVFSQHCLCCHCSQGPQRSLGVPQQCGQPLCAGKWSFVSHHLSDTSEFLTVPSLGSLGCLVLFVTRGMQRDGQAGTDLPAAKLPLKLGSNSVQAHKADFKAVFMVAEWLSGCRFAWAEVHVPGRGGSVPSGACSLSPSSK